MPGFSWILEIIQRIPAYILLSALFLYGILYRNPQREEWWWTQLQTHQKEQAMVINGIMDQQRIAIKELETQCYTHIKNNYALTVENRKSIVDIDLLLTEHVRLMQEINDTVEKGTAGIYENRQVLIEYGKLLDDLKMLIRKAPRK